MSDFDKMRDELHKIIKICEIPNDMSELIRFLYVIKHDNIDIYDKCMVVFNRYLDSSMSPTAKVMNSVRV